MFMNSCRELLARGLSREGEKRPFLRAHPATGFFSWRAVSVSSQPDGENWAQTTVGITKTGEREKKVINATASHTLRAAQHASVKEIMVGLGPTWGKKKRSLTDIRKIFGKLFKVFLSTPISLHVSLEMQIIWTSDSMHFPFCGAGERIKTSPKRGISAF